MATIVTRAGKGAPLTHNEVDANFTNLNTDKIQSGDSVASLDINGGTIDGTVIGGSTPAAIRGTTGQFGTSLNVDGTVTADGLTVGNAFTVGSVLAAVNIAGSTAAASYINLTRTSADTNSGILNFGKSRAGSAIVNGDFLGALQFNGDDGTDINTSGARIRSQVTGTVSLNTMPTSLFLQTTETSSGPQDRIKIAENGDISFYEDTGTTPKFFWDASAERLGIGTSSPAYPLHVSSATTGTTWINSNNSNTGAGDGAGFFGSNNGVNSVLYSVGGAAGVAGTTTNHPFALLTNNTERVRITSTGSVGIGTSSPSDKLEVLDGALMLKSSSASGYPNLKFENGSRRYDVQIDGATQAFRIVDNTASAERLRITSTGSVGIGTSSPAARLHIAGTVATGRPAVYLENTTASTGRTYYLGANDGGTLSIHDVTAGSERLRIDASGNLLVGATANPDGAKLYIDGGTISHSGGQLNARPGSGVQYELVNRVGAGFDFYVNNASNLAARIDASGNVGIGTTTTGSYRFNVLRADGNTAFFTDGTTADLFIKCASSVTTISPTTGVLAFGTSSTERARIDSSGNLLVSSTDADPALNGTAQAITLREDGRISARGADNFPAMTLSRGGTDGNVINFYKVTTLVGSISVTATATAYNTSSDYRLKEDVQPMSGASDRVLALNPVNFAWKVDGTRVDGFLAHEAQAVVPEAVTGEKDGEEMQAIDHSKLVPLLTAALQEALQKIEALEARITALEA